MIKSTKGPTPRLTVSYSANRKVTLAPVKCLCGRELHAPAVEVIGNDEVRLVCSGCNAVILLIEPR